MSGYFLRSTVKFDFEVDSILLIFIAWHKSLKASFREIQCAGVHIYYSSLQTSFQSGCTWNLANNCVRTIHRTLRNSMEMFARENYPNQKPEHMYSGSEAKSRDIFEPTGFLFILIPYRHFIYNNIFVSTFLPQCIIRI